MILCTVTTLHASEPQEKKMMKTKAMETKVRGKMKMKTMKKENDVENVTQCRRLNRS